MLAHRAALLSLPSVALLGLALAGCPSKESLGSSALGLVGAGVINNPKNRTLRFDMLKFGLDQFCHEMLKLGAPLKLDDDQPVIGRFFADSCNSQVIDTETHKSFVVQYAGKGFAWSNVTGRVGFSAAGLVEFAPDFQMNDGALYVYFRSKKIDDTTFQTLMMESAVARGGIAAVGADPDAFGRQVMKSELERGFTVVRYDSGGQTDFSLGILPKGERPYRPFQIEHANKLVLANDRTEIHAGQQDFVGGFEVDDDDQALYLTVSVDGAPAIDAFVVPKAVGDQMIARYVQTAGAAPLAGPALIAEPASAGQLWKRFVRVPKGAYYLVLDNSAMAGAIAPTTAPGDDRAAKVDYLVEVGDAP